MYITPFNRYNGLGKFIFHGHPDRCFSMEKNTKAFLDIIKCQPVMVPLKSFRFFLAG